MQSAGSILKSWQRSMPLWCHTFIRKTQSTVQLAAKLIRFFRMMKAFFYSLSSGWRADLKSRLKRLMHLWQPKMLDWQILLRSVTSNGIKCKGIKCRTAAGFKEHECHRSSKREPTVSTVFIDCWFYSASENEQRQCNVALDGVNNRLPRKSIQTTKVFCFWVLLKEEGRKRRGRKKKEP